MIQFVLCSILMSCVSTLSAAPTLVVLVRHAEKEALPADDPNLTATGKQRAKQLAHIASTLSIGGNRVKALFSTRFKRTKQTLEPLSAQTTLPVTAIDDVAALASAILAKDGIVVVAGHTNTLPDLIRRLGGPAGITIDDNDFSRLFLLASPATPRVSLASLRYSADGR